MDVFVVAFVAAMFANLPAVAGRALGIGAAAGIPILGLVIVPAVVRIATHRRGVLIDAPWLLFVAFLATLVIPTIAARDTDLALRWLQTFTLEVLVVYFLLMNSVRSLVTLRRAIWGLMLTGTLLSGLVVYQEIAHAPEQQFAGFAQRDLTRGPAVEAHVEDGVRRTRDRVLLANRALGPVGDPNRFAQVLLFVLPLAMFRIPDEKGMFRRLLALGCTLAIAGGIFLTYSRGAFFALAVVVLAALVWRDLRVRDVVPAAVIVAVLAVVLAPGTMLRLQRLASLPTLLSDRQFATADGAVRGRLTEMLSAYHVFLDHPWIGVGPAHYTPYYSETYMADPSTAFRELTRPRRAHSLYLEMAAETGLLGIVGFLSPIALLLVRLRGARRRWTGIDAERQRLMAAFSLGLVSYLATAMFLHLSYQHYLGVLLGLVGASVHVVGTRAVAAIRVPATRPLPAAQWG